MKRIYKVLRLNSISISMVVKFGSLLAMLLMLGTPLVFSRPSSHSVFKQISPSNRDFIYSGRVNFSNPSSPVFYWGGNSAIIGFTGRKLNVILNDKEGDNYFDIIIDGNWKHRHVIACKKGRHVYEISNSLPDTHHIVAIFRRTDPTYPGTKFDGIEIGQSAKVFHPDLHYKLKIAFYGDSITAGYGVLDKTRRNERDGKYMDDYVAYDAVTARHFHADYRSISRSGIGIIKSWYPLTMPQMYNRLNPGNPNSHWNFSKWTPNIVVVNLFQNDDWLLAREKNPPTPRQIENAYIKFVHSLFIEYPKATYICMLGNMDITQKGSPWPRYVHKAVQEMKKRWNIHIYDLFVPYKKTPGHPNIVEQKSLAGSLIRKIHQVYFHK